MIRPICYNIPEGKSEQEALSDELLEALEGVFQGVTHAFGDNATLYRLDIGRVYESVKSGDLVVAGQFVDRSDGEVFDFEINQGTGKVGYKSTGDFLDQQSLSGFLGEMAGEDDNGPESSDSGPYPFDLLLQAINEESTEAYQSPFASKLRKDLDYLGALSALMYHAGATIEAQPLYTGLHSYAIKYALRGLRLFSQSIGSIQSEEAGKAAEAWVDEHGLDFASAVVKEFSARRCVRFQESIQAEDQDGIQELKTLVEEAIGMAMATTTDLIKSVVEADDYRAGDVQATLAAAIEEYCPIDNSEGYSAVENARQLSEEWQEVVNRSGCSEDLRMQALGLPSAQTIPSEQGGVQAPQIEATAEEDSEDDQNPEGERIFYVNVGEGPSRNWDDCRQVGFLAAGGGRKWSKQLEKLKIGDTVIAYLKGYGYVGIGKVTSTVTPANKFTVNGVLINELPLVNNTICSSKHFDKENGEYLIGVNWQFAVSRGQAVWEENAGLLTTPLVCASLAKQPCTIDYATNELYDRYFNESGFCNRLSIDEASWPIFCNLLHEFLETQNALTRVFHQSTLLSVCNTLREVCPRSQTPEDAIQARAVIEGLTFDMRSGLYRIIAFLIAYQDPELDKYLEDGGSALVSAMFLLGIYWDDEELNSLWLEANPYWEDGSDLIEDENALNIFEAFAFEKFISGYLLSDFQFSKLITKADIGLSNRFRENVIIKNLAYGGDQLKDLSMIAICETMSNGRCAYTDQARKIISDFVFEKFASAYQEAVAQYDILDDSDGIEYMQNNFNRLEKSTIKKCRRLLKQK